MERKADGGDWVVWDGTGLDWTSKVLQNNTQDKVVISVVTSLLLNKTDPQ